MTNKQIHKYANQFIELEKLHKEITDLEEKEQIENKIMKLTNQILSLHDGHEVLFQIDEYIIKAFELENKGE